MIAGELDSCRVGLDQAWEQFEVSRQSYEALSKDVCSCSLLAFAIWKVV